MEEAKAQYTLRRTDLLFPELSFQINAILFDVFRELGGGHDERYYQKAVSLGLQETKVPFKEQYYVPLRFHDKVVGKYFLDFLIDDKIVLELKRGKFVSIHIINQTKEYLSALNLQLALIACFTHDGVFTKRIVSIS